MTARGSPQKIVKTDKIVKVSLQDDRKLSIRKGRKTTKEIREIQLSLRKYSSNGSCSSETCASKALQS